METNWITFSSERNHEYMRAGLLISDTSPFSAGAKVWIPPLQAGDSSELHFVGLVLRPGPQLRAYLSNQKCDVHFSESKSELIRLVSDLDLDCIVTDDFLFRMRLGAQIAGTHAIPRLTYCHIFFGLQLLNPRLHHAPIGASKFLSVAASSFPFVLASSEYRRLLGTATVRIANSMFTSLMISTLYGVEVHDVLYPAIDPSVFKPPENPGGRDVESAVVYTGRKGELGRVDLREVLRVSGRWGVKTYEAFGYRNSWLGQEAARAGIKVRWHSDMSEGDLANLYGQSSLTFAPQRWENFGFVGPESLSCGTPIVLSRYQPWLEITGMGPFVRILNPDLSSSSDVSRPSADLGVQSVKKSLQNLQTLASPASFTLRLARQVRSAAESLCGAT